MVTLAIEMPQLSYHLFYNFICIVTLEGILFIPPDCHFGITLGFQRVAKKRNPTYPRQ